MARMIRARYAPAVLAALIALATPARADVTVCNRTSYRMQVALAFERGPLVSTQGWLNIDPGECTSAAGESDMVYVHARTPPLYGSAPLPQHGDAEFCIREGEFRLPDARACPMTQQAHFSAARPSDTPKGPTINLAEEAGYDDAQARLAGIQRLLTLAGYDAAPFDGIDGAKTRAALARFLRDQKLTADDVAKPGIFDRLTDAARRPGGSGFTWCNQTSLPVMAALGLVEMGSIVTRGWYRIPAGQCLKPELSGEPMRFYSYAEAVDANGKTVQRGGAPLAWGGKVALCTRDGRFELPNPARQHDCAARGLNTAGFAVIEAADHAATVTFK
jgi:uncharacterized membrane protein